MLPSLHQNWSNIGFLMFSVRSIWNEQQKYLCFYYDAVFLKEEIADIDGLPCLWAPTLLPPCCSSLLSGLFSVNQIHLFTPGRNLSGQWIQPLSTPLSVSRSFTCIGFWFEQTRASCGTETPFQLGTPLSVYPQTLRETWQSCSTWPWMATRPMWAPVRNTSSESIFLLM